MIRPKVLDEFGPLWRDTLAHLETLGVTKIDPTCRGICRLWASTRKVTPAQLATRYLYELVELSKALQHEEDKR